MTERSAAGRARCCPTTPFWLLQKRAHHRLLTVSACRETSLRCLWAREGFLISCQNGKERQAAHEAEALLTEVCTGPCYGFAAGQQAVTDSSLSCGIEPYKHALLVKPSTIWVLISAASVDKRSR